MFWLLIFVLLALLCWAISEPYTGHKWVHRNPYTRTCTVCDRQEDFHCWPGDMGTGRGWWEEMREGAGKKMQRSS